MRDDSFISYLGTRDGRLSLALVVTCALILAYFVGRTAIVPLPKSYRLDFGAASWIEPPTGSQSGYFRKTLFIPGRVDRAWVQIAATDNYELYVNDFKFSQRWLVGARVSNVHEIAAFLKPGKNVLAIHVNRVSFPGSSQILVRGFYSPRGSPLLEFVSDASWRTSGTPDGIMGGYQWSARDLDDSSWAYARKAASNERISTIQSISFDPRLLQTWPTGKWIEPSDPGVRSASFVYHLKLDSLTPEQRWMSVAATGPYDILINGRLAFTQTVDLGLVALSLGNGNSKTANLGFGAREPEFGPLTEAPDLLAIQPPTTPPIALLSGRPSDGSQTPRTPGVAPDTTRGRSGGPSTQLSITTPRRLGYSLPFPAIPQPSSLPPAPVSGARPMFAAPVLLGYDISRWLRFGDNLIICKVRPESGPVALLAEFTRDLPNGGVERFGTDTGWRAILNNDSGSGALKNVRVFAAYGDSPWGVLPQAIRENLPSAPLQDLRDILIWTCLITTTLAILIVLWMATSFLCASISGQPRVHFLNSDALLHLAVIGPALLLLLLAYDVRFDPDWCFTPANTAALILFLLLAKILLIFHSRSGFGSDPSVSKQCQTKGQRGRFWALAAVSALVLVGFGLRAPHLTAVSLDVDEFGVIQYSDGVLRAGYPFIRLGSFTKTATTYELISYTIAASRALFGTSEAAFRFPSLFFGTLMIALIAWVGYRLVDWRVGLTAAVIYTFFPSAIWWSRNAFYPAQEQMLALITIWCFYEAVRTRPIHRIYLTAASIAFVLTYLSWEGSGFLIPVMLLCLLSMKWGEYDWISDWHLWRCFFLVSCAVLIQLIHRQFSSMPSYLQTGASLADVSTPQLVYLDPTTYNPAYYIHNCLLQENFYAMTLVIVLGVAFCWRHRGIRYMSVMLFALLICYTGFLPAYTIRYSCNYHPLLMLLSVAILFTLRDRISGLDVGNAPRWLRMMKWEAPAALVALLVLSANGFVLKTYRLSISPSIPIIGGRIGVYKTDYRGAALFVARNWVPGDGLIVTIPHIFEFYAGRTVDYSASTMLSKKITYDGGRAEPQFIDKFRGHPTIRGLEELEHVRTRYRRLWMVQVPADDPIDPLVAEYLRQKGRIVFQGHKSKVVLLEGANASLEQVQVPERESNGPVGPATVRP